MKPDTWKRGKVNYLFFNNEIVPYEQAVIHVTTPAYRYGAMVFEGLRGYWNDKEDQMYLFRVPEHCRRLNQSLKMTRMDLTVTVEEMTGNLIQLIRKNEVQETIHFIYSAYLGGDGPMSSTGPIGTAIEIRRLGRMFDIENGIRCSTSSWRRNTDDASPMRIKSAANYQNSRFALLQAKQDGYDNAILLTASGKVSEGTGACLCMVRDGRLVTPSITSDILESITRDTIIKMYYEQFDTSAVERSIDRTELYVADEIFFCGSGYEIVPIVNVDGFSIGSGTPGEVTRQLMETYRAVVTGKNSDHADWRTPVYG